MKLKVLSPLPPRHRLTWVIESNLREYTYREDQEELVKKEMSSFLEYGVPATLFLYDANGNKCGVVVDNT